MTKSLASCKGYFEDWPTDTLFKVPFYREIQNVRKSIERLPSWFLDASETGESTKCPWVGVVKGTAGDKK